MWAAFTIDLVLLALSCFGYLLRPHLRRLLAAGAGVRLKRARLFANSLLATSARGLSRCWIWLQCLTKHERKLLALGEEIERFCDGTSVNKQNDCHEDDSNRLDSNAASKINTDQKRPKRLGQELALAAARLHYSNKLSRVAKPATGQDRCQSASSSSSSRPPHLEFRVVSPILDPIVCSLNWINSDLICSRSNSARDCSSPSSASSLSQSPSQAIKRKLADKTLGNLSDTSDGPTSGHGMEAHETGKFDDCTDDGQVLSQPNKGANSFSGKNNQLGHDAGRVLISTSRDQHPNEALTNSGRVVQQQQRGRGTASSNGDSGEEPPNSPGGMGAAGAKTGPNDDEGPRRLLLNGGPTGKCSLSSAGESATAALVNIKTIWSSAGDDEPQRELIMIQHHLKQPAAGQQQQQQRDRVEASADRSKKWDLSRNETAEPKASDPLQAQSVAAFCLVELAASERLLVLDNRSSLIFYFIQLYSNQLVRLFGLIAALLERAGLLEPTGFCCRPSPTKTKMATGPDQLNDWLELVGWQIANQNDQSLGEKQCQVLIDRYALLLMIVAHLERERCGAGATSDRGQTDSNSSSSSNEQIRLASSLVNFFECYSSNSSTPSDGHLDRSKPKGASVLLVQNAPGSSGSDGSIGGSSNKNVKMEIEFLGRGYEQQLVVLDPIWPRASGKSHEQVIHCQANLTARLGNVWSDIRQLFADCGASLRGASLDGDKVELDKKTSTLIGSKSDASLLSPLDELFELADGMRQKMRSLRPDLSEQLAQIWTNRPNSASVVYHLDRCTKQIVSNLATNNDDDDDDNNDDNANQSRPAGMRSRWRSAWARARFGRLSRSIIYLTLFLVVRALLLSYLTGLQRDLMHESRRDFIAFKRMVFPEGLRGLVDEGQGDEGEEERDGISILIRDEREEKQRRAAEAAKLRANARSTSAQAKSAPANDHAQPNHEPDHHITSQLNNANADEMNQVMQALVSGLLSQALGGTNGGDLGKIDPSKLEEMMRMFTEETGSDGDELGEDEDEGPMSESEVEEMAKMLEQMQLLTGQTGPKLDAQSLAKLMGGVGERADPRANIDFEDDDESEQDETEVVGQSQTTTSSVLDEIQANSGGGNQEL